MKKYNSMSKHQSLPCSETREGDGVDPRQFFDRSSKQKTNRKARQLCAQVADTINGALNGEIQDDRLFGLTAVAVEAVEHNRLIVTVASPQLGDAEMGKVVMERLANLAGRIRHEVATVICRKRIPELTFQLANPNEVDPWMS